MITLDDVTKVFPGGVTAVDGLSLEVREGETVVLLGTSGCGKTTTLKMVNRLVEPTSGCISINGTDITEQDPIELRRSIGYAIQDIGLFPHITVGENIAVVPHLLRWPRDQIAKHVDELLTMVGLDPTEFHSRLPVQLSGGQQQRVGVARALAGDPPIVLMDEPFGALDPITRETLQDEFIDLQSEIRKTVLFVTHDVFEAVKMGDRIALLREGRLEQLAAPVELVESPASEFVDQFLGQHRFQLSLLTSTVHSVLSDLVTTDAPGPAPSTKGPHLRARSSLIQALDTFKRTGQSTLPVYQGSQFRGVLSKQQLLHVIARVLGEAGEANG